MPGTKSAGRQVCVRILIPLEVCKSQTGINIWSVAFAVPNDGEADARGPSTERLKPSFDARAVSEECLMVTTDAPLFSDSSIGLNVVPVSSSSKILVNRKYVVLAFRCESEGPEPVTNTLFLSGCDAGLKPARGPDVEPPVGLLVGFAYLSPSKAPDAFVEVCLAPDRGGVVGVTGPECPVALRKNECLRACGRH